MVTMLLGSGDPKAAAKVAVDGLDAACKRLSEAARQHDLAAAHEAAADKARKQAAVERERLSAEKAMLAGERSVLDDERRQARQLRDSAVRQQRELANMDAALAAERAAVREDRRILVADRAALETERREVARLREQAAALSVELRARLAAIEHQDDAPRRSRRAEKRAPVATPDRDESLKPDPATAGTEADLVKCLAEFRSWAGNRSYRDVAAEAGLSPSNVHGILKRDRLPAKLDVLEKIVTGCGGSLQDKQAFATAWRRFRAPGPQAPPPLATVRALRGTAPDAGGDGTRPASA
jgi:hypothetical protein